MIIAEILVVLTIVVNATAIVRMYLGRGGPKEVLPYAIIVATGLFGMAISLFVVVT